MKIKIKQIINSQNSLGILFNSEDLSIETSWDIQKIVKSIRVEIDQYNDLRGKLLNKYSDECEKERKFKGETEKDEYIKEINVLLEKEIELNINKLNIKNLSGVKISPSHLETLEYLLEK